MPGLGRAVSDTCNGEKEKCETGVLGVMPKALEAKLHPVISVME